MDAASLAQTLSSFADSQVASLGEAERRALLGAATKLRDALESPVEKLIRVIFGVQEAAVLRLAIDMGVIDIAVEKKGPISVGELADKSKADSILIYRVQRMLANLGFFHEVDVGVFTALPMAAAFVTGSPLKESAIHLSTTLTTVAQFPEYFASVGYKNPIEAANGPWQYTHKTTDDYFTWLKKQDPKYQSAFNVAMSLQNAVRGQQWFEYFPFEEKLKVDSPDRAAFVDVGGNLGHDLRVFHEKHPTFPGKLILEDLPQVIADVKDLPSAIQPLAHDFFAPQPIKGAKCYYMRIVLHDWPDVQAKQILNNTREAMAPDSILLLNEGVLAEKNSPWIEPHLDFHMLTFVAAGERTERQWRALLEGCGFDVVKIWAST
ncbi:S-adenosyl-L-methionine-dependent methyltransferase [Lophiotrema nucula]|uniref:S-adenosyl-L-methionine-dependent methyltransferase n=1 Tax=Lophiotrema nucula TaxID=690887 RepID=A0A6A5Z130_9PLEO|nr:S-adenosyl-L-methionine-dependent methyltransferase [Lophiotrema nucula]